jgi:dolichol-phosphate mannosyltransferase
MHNPPETKPARALTLLSVIIPARDEEGCIASTIEHLHLELSLHGVPNEIVVVDDGSTDSTWQIFQGEAAKIPTLRPIQNLGPHGFGRAITKGLDSMAGDAVVIMMADESDDCRDVVRYWHALNEGYDCVFGCRFLKHGGVIDYPRLYLALNRAARMPSSASSFATASTTPPTPSKPTAARSLKASAPFSRRILTSRTNSSEWC